MATTELSNNDNNHVVCADCWEVFLNPVELELHQGNCTRIIAGNKVAENAIKVEPRSEGVIKVEENGDAHELPNNEATELTVLKAMPPTDDGTNSQNGELLSVFEQTQLLSPPTTEGSPIHRYNLSLPTQSILSSYIQQQQSLSEQNLKQARKQLQKEVERQELMHQQQQQQQLQQQQQQQQHHIQQLLNQQKTISDIPVKQNQELVLNTSTAMLLENGIASPPLTSSKPEKNGRRKVLSKVGREFTHIFQCTQCDLMFNNDASYRDHARSHAKVKEFVCEYCGITLTKYEQMTKHLDKEHNSDLSYYCYLCYSPADDKAGLVEHLKYCGKNDTSKVHLTPSTSQLLPNLLSGSTFKYNYDMKSFINCPKCGTVLGTEDTLNIQDKPVDVQCKYCATVVTLMRQASASQSSSILENKSPDLMALSGSIQQHEPLVLSTTDELAALSANADATKAGTAPLLLYSQPPLATALGTPPITSPCTTMADSTFTAQSSLSSVNLSTMTMNGPNHMTLGINTSNGLVVLTVPVVTADKMGSESMTSTPLLQLPTGNIFLLGADVNDPLSSLNTSSASTISSPVLQTQSPMVTTTAVATPISTTDILMTAAAGINAPTSDSPGVPLGLVASSEPAGATDLKLKAARYTCSHCGKAFELYQSWRRHEQNHTAPKKQHPCQTCGKTFTRPGQLREHTNKVHGKLADGEASNNKVAVKTES